MRDNALTRMQSLLRELFQFDCQDLDFGIYRVLNLKRREIEDFIANRLPQRVDAAFARYAEADRAAAERELEQKRQQILASLGPNAFDASGQLTMTFRETPLGQEYGKLQQDIRTGRVADELKESVFNDLYAFFSRYYDEGDIFSKPRRGKVEIPFTGHEDVVLHWANKDQYYIKTGERFKTYRFTLPNEKAAVVFALRNVSAEPNNNRAEKRYFVLAEKDPVEWTEDRRELTVYFEYRPLTEEEKAKYGKTETQRPQDKINADAESAILRRVKDPTARARLAEPASDGRPSLLLQHLTRFTRKNTSDFFIHKDLGGFLRRELDDFLKTEVLKTDELLAGDSEVPRRALLRAQVVRQIALALIDWLAQIEDFQKKLFEKRKFVVRTEYCVTLDRLPEDLWDEVLANRAQIEEWRQLYALDDLLKADKKKKPDRAFLKAHDKLVVDTRHFSETFKWRLLESFDDLDAALDGLCIKSENFQALALLLAKYRERVKCIYIDPPYNTGNDEFIYRDNYQHSCWLAMMRDRLSIARSFLNEQGVVFIDIDDNEHQRLALVMEETFGPENFVSHLIWHNSYRSAGKAVSTVHEYITCYATRLSAQPEQWTRQREAIGEMYDVLNTARSKGATVGECEKLLREFVAFRTRDEQGERKYGWLRNYCNVSEDWHIYYPVDLSGDGPGEPRRFGKKLVPPPPGRHWMSQEYIDELMAQGRIVWRGSRPYKKVLLEDAEERFQSLIYLPTRRGREQLRDVFGHDVFNNPKPWELIELALSYTTQPRDRVLDFFAGSGSTGEACFALARKDGLRKFLLVELAEYAETVLVPRLKKVVFCSEWKDGKPAGGAGVSHLMKYQVLEQYEDTLNNLELPRAGEGELALREFGDEYLLKYMLAFETAGSPSLLNIERMTHPFAYRLKVQEGDEIVERTVDLIETFNYLLGLHVKKVREFRDGERLYRVVFGEDRRGRTVVAIWRDSADLEGHPAGLKADRRFIRGTILPELLGRKGRVRPERLFVNQPCIAVGAEAIEPEFKRLMFAPLG